MPYILSRLGRDGTAGVAIAVAGLVGFWLVHGYPIGTLDEFGPGFMPWVSTLGMIALGTIMAARAAASGIRMPFTITVGRALVLVPLGMAVFAFALAPLGLALASALAVIITSFASQESRLGERLAAAVVLAALVTVVFGYGLKMSVPLWPPVLTP